MYGMKYVDVAMSVAVSDSDEANRAPQAIYIQDKDASSLLICTHTHACKLGTFGSTLRRVPVARMCRRRSDDEAKTTSRSCRCWSAVSCRQRQQLRENRYNRARYLLIRGDNLSRCDSRRSKCIHSAGACANLSAR